MKHVIHGQTRDRTHESLQLIAHTTNFILFYTTTRSIPFHSTFFHFEWISFLSLQMFKSNQIKLHYRYGIKRREIVMISLIKMHNVFCVCVRACAVRFVSAFVRSLLVRISCCYTFMYDVWITNDNDKKHTANPITKLMNVYRSILMDR